MPVDIPQGAGQPPQPRMTQHNARRRVSEAPVQLSWQSLLLLLALTRSLGGIQGRTVLVHRAQKPSPGALVGQQED